jgi:hypothetical protein
LRSISRCVFETNSAVHRAIDAQRHLRAQLAVREALVRTHTRYIAIIKATMRREDLRLLSGEAEHTATKLLALPSLQLLAVSWHRISHGTRRQNQSQASLLGLSPVVPWLFQSALGRQS